MPYKDKDDQLSYFKQYERERFDKYVVRFQKSELCRERIERAITRGIARSYNDYIVQAVHEKLDRDGV